MAKDTLTYRRRELKDLSGNRYGQLTVISLVDKPGPWWNCLCDCGNTRIARSSLLELGHVKSCGCMARGRHRLDLSGIQVGHLTVLSIHEIRAGRAYWLCKCDCGKMPIVAHGHIRNGQDSCGCYGKERQRRSVTTHGMHRTPEYRSWRNAKERCFNPAHRRYGDYGGRGITMCDEWREDFAAFFAYIGPRPYGTTLDRIDNGKGYGPGNVQWATPGQQATNRRRPRPGRH